MNCFKLLLLSLPLLVACSPDQNSLPPRAELYQNRQYHSHHDVVVPQYRSRNYRAQVHRHQSGNAVVVHPHPQVAAGASTRQMIRPHNVHGHGQDNGVSQYNHSHPSTTSKKIEKHPSELVEQNSPVNIHAHD